MPFLFNSKKLHKYVIDDFVRKIGSRKVTKPTKPKLFKSCSATVFLTTRPIMNHVTVFDFEWISKPNKNEN